MRKPNSILAAAGAIAITIVSAVFFFPRLAAAGPASPQALAPAGKVVETDPARDAALRSYLQKHFKIPNVAWIKLGPATETPIKGLLARQLTVTNDQGQSVQTAVFVDKNETKAIIGQFLDTTQDPWGRIDMSKIHLEDRPVLGPADAPVTVVEFADFECPYCAHAFSVVETMVNTTYKGKIKVIFKNYPLNAHLWAPKASAAAECARLQNPDAFWAFARYFYTNQGSITPQNLPDKVDGVAKDLKLDDSALRACMDSPQTADRVKQDLADGNAVKVNSTPTFFVNGIPVVGLPENKGFDFVVDAELAAGSPAAH